MVADQLSAPGSSSYDSSTMVVGDGTWDSTDNTFLLPNLVGLNLATTQYNGMGNRFKDLAPYHSLIAAHAAIACVIFLLLIPAAILIARFSQSRRSLAIRTHIWIHILVVFLSTVVLILGWFAVGPARSLTNPHHAIGVALYTLIMVQFLGGALMRRLEKRKDRDYIPVKVMLHHWFGRIIALLGFAQIPLGFALYGSPQGYFIMYTLVMVFWILLYFILSHRFQSERSIGSEYDSHVSGRTHGRSYHEDVVSERRDRREKHESHALRDTALIGGALAALAAMRGRRKDRERERSVVDEEVVEPARRSGSHRTGSHRSASRISGHRRLESDSVVDDEKYAATRPAPEHTWRDRIIGAGAGLAAFERVRRLFSTRRERDEEESIAGYSQPPLGDNSVISHADVSRVQSGQVPFSPDARRVHRTEVTDLTTVDSAMDSPTRPRPPRSSRLTHESIISGPLHVPPASAVGRPGPDRRDSFSSESSFLSVDSPSAPQPTGITKGQGIAATLAGVTGLAYLREKAKQRRLRKEERRSEELRRYDEDVASSRPRPHRRMSNADESVFDDDMRNDIAITGSDAALSRHRHPNISMPPLPPSAGVAHSETELSYISNRPPGQPGYPLDDTPVQIPTGPGPASDARFKGSNTSRVHFSDDVLPAAAAGTAAALATSALSTNRQTPPRRPAEPVAVKVRIHDDNRHVTLRRLNEAEAAAERDARRRRRPRTSSLGSDLDDASGAGYRRRYQPHMSTQPPPPPVHTSPMLSSPATSQGMHHSRVISHGVGSPSMTGTGTEMSQFDENRRRRRAERAAAKTREIEGPVPLGARGEYD